MSSAPKRLAGDNARSILGLVYVVRGLRYLGHPRLRKYTLWPILANVLLFLGGLVFVQYYLTEWLNQLINILPDWLAWVDTVLWWLCLVALLFLSCFTFTIGLSLLLAPFCGLLAETTEQVYLQVEHSDPTWSQLGRDIPRVIRREFCKLSYYLPRLLLVGLLFLIPGLNLAAPCTAFMWTCWMLSLQTIDYSMDNHRLTWPETLTVLQEHRLTCMSFGAGVFVFAVIPLLNIVVVPVSVIGATLLYCDCIKAYQQGKPV